MASEMYLIMIMFCVVKKYVVLWMGNLKYSGQAREALREDC